MMALREKSFLLAHAMKEAHNLWVPDMQHTSWRVHPDTYAEMLRESREELKEDPSVRLPDWSVIPVLYQPPDGLRIVNWLGIPLLRDADVPEGEIELRWAVRSA